MLRVIADTAPRPLSIFRATAEPASLASGFSFEEWDDMDRFHWMERQAEISIEQKEEEYFFELWVLSTFHDLSQTLRIRASDVDMSFSLPHWWSRVSIPVPPGVTVLDLEANKLLPAAHHPGDPRELAIQVRPPVIHAERERHLHIDRQHQNAVRNITEMLAGDTQPSSTPRMLGIDMHGVCNVKPPCVYCDWDAAKDLEGENVEAPFTRETIEEWADFYDNAGTLVNCSIGEPFMMKNLDELFDIFGNHGKALEMTTNGQILTERNIEKLLDRDIELYISLDSATSETYAKLRNDRFEAILANLRRLIAAKKGRQGLPRVHLVFMPMRCNVHELEAFVELCADLEVDRMVLRPLNYSDSIHLKWERDGYTFDYQDELLPFEDLVRFSAQAAALSRRHGVPLSDQMDFGGAMEETFSEQFTANVQTGFERHRSPLPEQEVKPEPAGEAVPSLGEDRLPACHEPWTSLYILRRGTLPCCYGGSPIAEMAAASEVWNGALLQEIRSELAAGRFHRYCLDSPSCPIVRKSQFAGSMPAAQAIFLRAREIWHAVDRRCHGVPGLVLRPVKWVVLKFWKTSTPGREY